MFDLISFYYPWLVLTAQISKYSAHPDEEEYLFAPNSEFRIKAILAIGNDA